MARRNKCLKISKTRKMALAVSSCRSIGVLGAIDLSLEWTAPHCRALEDRT